MGLSPFLRSEILLIKFRVFDFVVLIDPDRGRSWRSVSGCNPRLDLPALSEGLSAATQNHADHVGGLFYDDNKLRARTHLLRPLEILIIGNMAACFVHCALLCGLWSALYESNP